MRRRCPKCRLVVRVKVNGCVFPHKQCKSHPGATARVVWDPVQLMGLALVDAGERYQFMVHCGIEAARPNPSLRVNGHTMFCRCTDCMRLTRED